MRTKGKDKDYRKALYRNLILSLKNRKRIKTTLPKAKKIKSAFLKKYGGAIRMFKLGQRKGDDAEMVILDWLKKEANLENENKTDKKEANKKKLASR